MGRNVFGAVVGWVGFLVTMSELEIVFKCLTAILASIITILTILGWVQHYKKTGRMWIGRDEE